MSVIVNGKRCKLLDLKSRMDMYNKLESFNKTEIIKQRNLEISDYQTELELAKKIYNEEYIKILESKFIKWLNEDIEREFSF
jgi:sulfatase maturation enzyme AslB (radical SAM superfamily)